jgi:8-oxo-dGTP pyrophosphatase MutT (NUDIX family)
MARWWPGRGPTVAPWKVLRSSYAYADKFIRLRIDTVRLPDGTELSPYHMLEFDEWVCAIALTAGGRIVLVEEYRHGAGRAMIEFPSGGVAQRDEQPLAAVKRELEEETGYAGGTWHALGAFFSNSAHQTNRTHAFLALGVAKLGEPQLGPGEIIVTHETSWREFAAEAYAGNVELNSGHMACLLLLQQYVARSDDPAVRALLG